ncbi:MAG: M1 family metallopeptidase, partial [Nocardioides sp.]
MSLTLAEARHRATAIEVESYGIDLDLTGWERGRFACVTTVRFTSADPSTSLELTAAQDVSLESDVEALGWEYDGRRIRLEGLPTGRPVEVVVRAEVPYVTDGDGMHLMTDPEDGQTYASAYLSLDVAQRVFACFDQPDLKATFDVAVTADPRWTVLGNGRVTEHDEREGRWVFATTPRLCPSLFVVCAGPWHSVTWEHAGLPFGWHARASLAAELERDAEELKQTTTDCFDHYATLFDEAYPFDSYDQLFGPGHNWGAMETPGCVTYRDELLPRGRVTDDHRKRRAAIIAHEMAHMWFGNLVTMRWWEDTWLNESFADYMGYRVADAGAGFTGTLVLHEAARKPGAHVADERRSTHPVAPAPEDVPDVDSAFSNFDAISYSKGNSCLRQLVTWLGDEDFLAGVNAHLTRHAFDNATLDDLVSALDEASERDVRAWADAWLRTPGFDTVVVGRDDAGVPVLRREGSRPHRFSVTAFA